MKFDGISAEAERLFGRLIMKADDFGRYHAEPRLLRAGCFPLLDSLRATDLDRWLDELSNRQLVLRYEAGGRAFLSIINFRQRMKQSAPKFPPPPGKDAGWRPEDDNFREVPGSSGKFREVPAPFGDGDGDGGVCVGGDGGGSSPLPASQEKPGRGSQRPSDASLIIYDRELKRVNESIEKLRSGFESHQEMDDKSREKMKKLRERKAKLHDLLGVEV